VNVPLVLGRFTNTTLVPDGSSSRGTRSHCALRLVGIGDDVDLPSSSAERPRADTRPVHWWRRDCRSGSRRSPERHPAQRTRGHDGVEVREPVQHVVIDVAVPARPSRGCRFPYGRWLGSCCPPSPCHRIPSDLDRVDADDGRRGSIRSPSGCGRTHPSDPTRHSPKSVQSSRAGALVRAGDPIPTLCKIAIADEFLQVASLGVPIYLRRNCST
jgi:hypothetical protein